jgi:hypothetical protein
MELIANVSAAQEFARTTSFGILIFVIAFASLNYVRRAKHGTTIPVNVNASLKHVLTKMETNLSLIRRSANAYAPSLKFRAPTKQRS